MTKYKTSSVKITPAHVLEAGEERAIGEEKN